MSTVPASARIVPAAAVTAALSATSTATAHARRPSARTSTATFSEFSAVRDTQTTSAPSAANFKAIARPMPRPAPVTTATCPFKEFISPDLSAGAEVKSIRESSLPGEELNPHRFRAEYR